ncbi:MAG: ABC transporter permease [Candidatus Thermoplasmatota archaeon]
MKLTRLFLAVYAVMFFSALYTPIAILIGLSFNGSRNINVWGGFTTDWFGVALANTAYTKALTNSFVVALSTAGLSIVLGTFAGIGLARLSTGRFGIMWEALMLLPLIIPEIIEAISISWFYKALSIPNGVPATILGHTVFSVSFVALIVRARMGDVGRSYEEASMVLGANRLQTFGRIVLPLAAPAILAGAFLAFAASFDDVVKSIFTIGKDMLPIVVFAEAHRGGVKSPLLALATIMVMISVSAALLRVLTETRVRRE